MKKIKPIILFCLLLFVHVPFLCFSQGHQTKERQHPNIILFLVDDMGWEDSSVPFGDTMTTLNKRYHTPNMELLAKEGMKFTNAYADPVCSPSRVSLMTGMNPAHDRVTTFTSPLFKDKTTDHPDTEFRDVPWNVNGLSPYPGIPRTAYATPLPLLLRNAGYYTIMLGKGHFGPPGTPGSEPRNLGFDVAIAGHGAGSPQSYLGSENYGNIQGYTTIRAVPDLEDYYGSDTFLTKALTEVALKSLEAPLKYHQPFFLYLSQYAVHTPLTADKRYYQKYLDAGLSEPEAKYASMIEGMDQSLGTIMNFLKQHDLEKSTIIIFMSDNGGLALAPPRGGKPFTQNFPLRAGKGSVYEGGIREPMIVKWPGVTQPGSVANQYVIISDFFPTILQIAGVKKYQTIQHLDGKSFVPILKDSKFRDTSRVLIWHFPHYWTPEGSPECNYGSAIRQGSWKLVYRMRTQKIELYNLSRDISESKNLANKYPLKVKYLANLLTEKLKDWKAQMPVYKKTGKPVPWPNQVIK